MGNKTQIVQKILLGLLFTIITIIGIVFYNTNDKLLKEKASGIKKNINIDKIFKIDTSLSKPKIEIKNITSEVSHGLHMITIDTNTVILIYKGVEGNSMIRIK